MRMRKHFATGAALAAAAAMALTACGGGGGGTTASGTGTELNVAAAYTSDDFGPMTTGALPMGTNWQVL